MTKFLEDDFPDTLLVVPRLTTWSRLAHADPTGPRPLRSRAWPWGCPGLKPEEQRKVTEENALVLAVLDLIDNFLAVGSKTLILTAAEDLGKCRNSAPASLWQLHRLKRLALRRGLRRMALHQCHLGPCAWARPTGILSTHHLPPQTSRLGWPSVDWANDGKYNGPLCPACHCGRRHNCMLKRGGEYKSPARNLSSPTVNFLAAALVNASIYQAADYSTHAESLLKGGIDTYAALRERSWIPETGAPADQTEDEDDLLPPFSDSNGELESERGLGLQQASQSDSPEEHVPHRDPLQPTSPPLHHGPQPLVHHAYSLSEQADQHGAIVNIGFNTNHNQQQPRKGGNSALRLWGTLYARPGTG